MVKKKVVKKSVGKSSGSVVSHHVSSSRSRKPSPWAVATVVLVAVIVLWFLSGSGLLSGSGSMISESDASQMVLDFAASQGADASLVSSSEMSGLYEVVISIEGQEVPVYITTDGAYLIPTVVSYNEAVNAAP